QTGTILRSLFTTIIRDCLLANPMELWDLYKEYFCDNLCWQLSRHGVNNATVEEIYDYGLY
ncbi:hypothetical protein EI94DRAFT_1447785, partial [Lactarius quietus]